MKRLLPLLLASFALPLFAADVKPIDGATPEKLLGSAENLKIVTGAKEIALYRLTDASAKDSTPIDAFHSSNNTTLSGPEMQKAVAALSTPANFSLSESPAAALSDPALLVRFKTNAGTVDIAISFKAGEMEVYRDGKLVKRTLSKAESKNGFTKDASAAFIALAKKAFPDDADIKALPSPPMPTADLIAAIEAGGAAYYDHYHAIPATPENYVVTSALTGKTRDKESFVDISPSQISANGEVLDEWGTPLRFIFTQDSAKPLGAWSAGKDKIFGTDDDVSKPKPADIPGSEGQ